MTARKIKSLADFTTGEVLNAEAATADRIATWLESISHKDEDRASLVNTLASFIRAGSWRGGQ